jgi:hypothetical protein
MTRTFNPIASVTPCDKYGTVTGSMVAEIPAPSVFKYGMQDISGPNAGRLEDMSMNKERKGQARAIDLEWVLPTIAQASIILKAFNSEYALINFIDALEGTFITKRFYIGDRVATLLNTSLGRWESLAFTIIQQDADVV